MSVLLLHWRSWWARLLGFFGPAAPARPDRPEPHPAPAPMATTAETPAAPPTAARRQAETAPDVTPLLEIVQRASLATDTVTPVRPGIAREDMLARLYDLKQIPALQSLMQGILRTMSRNDVAVDDVLEAIGRDAALCVRVLRMANSVTVASEQRVEELPTAVQLLGVVTVRKAAQALFTLRDANRTAEGFDWRHLWVHALATASIAEELERRLRPAADSQIHLAALLHDVGKIVLSTLEPDAYRGVLMLAWEDGGRLETLERARLGVDHREAGVVFARENQLPEIVIQAIAHHDAPAAAESHTAEVALIALANHLSKAHGLGFSGARLTAADGEWAESPVWEVLQAECGPIDTVHLEYGLRTFLADLRTELRELRESV
jgi:putative nucleotidyltransferase with HDIG domain